MGNAGGNAPATLGVGLDNAQPCYSAGQPLSGRVYLSVTAADGTAADTLVLTVSGAERTTVHYTTTRTSGSGDNRRTKTVHHYARARRTFMYLEVPLATFAGGSCAAGQYEFPFSVPALPEGLPTSMYASADGGRSHAEVRYSIHVHLQRPGMFKRDVQADLGFVVNATPSPAVPTPVFLPPCTQAVKVCCCFAKGSMTLGALCDRAVVPRGGAMGVSFGVKNNSSKEMQRVECCLTEVVRWSAQGALAPGLRGFRRVQHRESTSRTLSQATFAPEQIPGAGSLLKSEMQGGASGAAMLELEACKAIHAQLMGSPGGVAAQQSLLSVDSARDSFAGQLMSVTHLVTIKLITACCATNPEVVAEFWVKPAPVGYAPPQGLLGDEDEQMERALALSADAAAPGADVSVGELQLRQALALSAAGASGAAGASSGGAVVDEEGQQLRRALAESAQWACVQCTFDNDAGADACATCDLPRSDAGGGGGAGSSRSGGGGASAATAASAAAPQAVAVASPVSAGGAPPQLLLPQMQNPTIAAASAPPLPVGWAPKSSVPTTVVSMAGLTMGGGVEDGIEEDAMLPSAPPAPGAGSDAPAGSLARLRSDMGKTDEDLAVIERFVAADGGASASTLAQLTAVEYGEIVSSVSYAFEQPQVAAALARALGSAMTCAHLAAAVGKASTLSKTDIVNAAAPLCADRAQNKATVLAQLSVFEGFLCEAALDAA